MKLVIDIDEKTYKDIMNNDKNTQRNLSHYEHIIAKGNPIAFCDEISKQSAIDLEELRHRFGNDVAFVVEDMIKGTNERWNSSEKTWRWVSSAMYGEVCGQIVRAFTCSKCGAISVFRMIDGKIVNGDSCANCRAKMEIEK